MCEEAAAMREMYRTENTAYERYPGYIYHGDIGDTDCVYQVMSVTRNDPYIGKVRCYGICVFSGKGLTERATEKDFCIIYDISRDPTKVLEIARILKENKVPPVHVRDIVEDVMY